ncbi:peptide chain release factor 1-like, mitochondrial [Uranotaenia lowii]|uniref:peptide chain release factor 1-like, mitochondrial n=1 Tax=Uranotaenia lowii TaxID=190385 RepID=UPI002479E750|nr:peptide chain release factor 1-like, mitochondrial [Uranotaenia lowii]
MFLRRFCCLRSFLPVTGPRVLARCSFEPHQKYSRSISTVITRFPTLSQQNASNNQQSGSKNGDTFPSSIDDRILRYLESLRTEYYALKVADKVEDKDCRRMMAMSQVVEMYEQRKIIVDNLSSLNEMSSEKDDDMLQLMREEKEAYSGILARLDSEIMHCIMEMDEEQDYSSLVLEVAAGVGGQEAMLFARELLDMYACFADYKEWEIEVYQTEDTELGGIRHAFMIINGRDAYKFLKFEAGVHRVQRVPSTEKSGRIHTSTATVSVIPRLDDASIELNEKDLKIETKRASGAGGQHVNTTDSAVRIVHLPTGISVECQTERSQIKNKEIAKQKLIAKLTQIQMDSRMNTTQSMKKSQVGTSLRNEKIRTYNYNQDRITDHRIEGGTTHNLKGFLQGNDQLEGMIRNVQYQHRKKQLMEIINRNVETCK